MKIDGGSQTMQCEPEVLAPAQPPPKVCVDRVEQARAEERAYAGERSAPAEKFYGLLQQVPSPGALELEVMAKLHHNGGKVKVTASRDEAGEYVIRVEGKLSAAIPLPASVGLTAGSATTWRVRTPEAAANLLQSLVMTGAAPAALDSGDAIRTAHYALGNLTQVELSLELEASGHFGPAVQLTGLEGSHGSIGTVDFDKHLLVTEVAVEGEAFTRGSLLAMRAGFTGDLSMKLRTKLELPDDVLARVASGELSAAELLRDSEATRKIVFEGESRAELHTLFIPGSAHVKKLEAEIDLDAFVSHPLAPGQALKGHIKTMVSDKQAAGFGFDVAGASVLVRGAIYSVTEQPLFQPHDEGTLQQELDLKRSVHR